MDWTNASQHFLGSLPFIVGMKFYLRPRKPKVIYAHFNRGLSAGFWLTTLSVLAPLVLVELLEINLPPYVVIPADVVGLAIGAVYWFYWSYPYSRKRTGVAAVDAAVERYKKPGEIVRGMVEGGWCPDLVIGESVYKLLTYRLQGKQEMIILDLQGRVVRDFETADKVVRLWRLAREECDVYHMNARMERYKKVHQGMIVQGTRYFLNRREKYLGFAQNEQERKDIETLLESLQVAIEHAKLLLRFLEQEAAVHERYGRFPVPERVSWQDLEELEAVFPQPDVLYAFLPELKRALRRLRTRKVMPKKLFYLVKASEAVREEVEKGFPTQAYAGFSEEEAAGWRSRLEWVDLVDGWIAQGLSGKELEAQKQAYLAEQARLEKERQREERRRRREERRREREERERRRAAEQAGADPEQQ